MDSEELLIDNNESWTTEGKVICIVLFWNIIDMEDLLKTMVRKWETRHAYKIKTDIPAICAA